VENSDTIAAVATAPGRGGIGIIRLSGPLSLAIAKTITQTTPQPRYAHLSSYHDEAGAVLDSGITLYFQGPNSFTGEDVIELQAHGGPVILDILLREACRLGARQARPGEFSERAFLNNKIDLAQAESIADLINSVTEQAAISASRSLSGEFSSKIDNLVEQVTRLRVYVEAAIDFPEEEIDFIEEGQVQAQLTAIVEQFNSVSQQAKQGALLQEGIKLVIAGKPNAGKSSLLNALSGQESAIVTAVAGTTRDVLREHIQIDGMPLHIVDTAGLRNTHDEIELEGIRRAQKEIDSADRILLVVDDATEAQSKNALKDYWPTDINRFEKIATPVTIVRNKCDISGNAPCLKKRGEDTIIFLSATTGEGLDLLRTHLKDSVGLHHHPEGQFSARRRHIIALTDAYQHLIDGQQQLEESSSAELLAEDLRQCQHALGEITGAFTTDALLGEIFSSFCIGK